MWLHAKVNTSYGQHRQKKRHGYAIFKMLIAMGRRARRMEHSTVHTKHNPQPAEPLKKGHELWNGGLNMSRVHICMQWMLREPWDSSTEASLVPRGLVTWSLFVFQRTLFAAERWRSDGESRDAGLQVSWFVPCEIRALLVLRTIAIAYFDSRLKQQTVACFWKFRLIAKTWYISWRSIVEFAICCFFVCSRRQWLETGECLC